MTKAVKRAYRYRFYPSPEQESELLRTFGCVRKVWNLALDARTQARQQRREQVSYIQSSAMLTEWKKSEEYSYLNEVSSVPLQQALRHLQGAFTSFWDKQTRYPRFKSRRKSRQSAEYTRSAFRYRDGTLTLAKMLHPLDIRHEQKEREKLAKAQRKLARKQKGSKNREKARRKVARVHARIADRRRDFLHKLTTRIVRENQAVIIEDLSVRNMLQNHSLARGISDTAWRDLRSMLEYKCDWYGRDLVVIDRWYPSSKTCSTCECLATSMPLNVREWDCAHCGTRHDRDVNAAKNILAAGLAVTACGGSVRPKRESSRAGNSR